MTATTIASDKTISATVPIVIPDISELEFIGEEMPENDTIYVYPQ